MRQEVLLGERQSELCEGAVLGPGEDGPDDEGAGTDYMLKEKHGGAFMGEFVQGAED